MVDITMLLFDHLSLISGMFLKYLFIPVGYVCIWPCIYYFLITCVVLKILVAVHVTTGFLSGNIVIFSSSSFLLVYFSFCSGVCGFQIKRLVFFFWH